MPEKSEHKPKAVALDVDRIGGLLDDVLKISKAWTICLVGAAILSAFRVSHPEYGGLLVGFHVTTTTVLLLALIWLPSLVRVIALTGGKFTTPAGEATTSGLLALFRDLPPETRRETLPPIIAAFDMAAAERPSEGMAARHARDDLESQLAAAEPTTEDPEGVLRGYAEQYDRLREELEPGQDRTFRMNSLLAEARAVSSRASLGSEDVRELFDSDSPGLRMMAIASLQVRPDPSAFDVLLDAISSSRSAFEQYHALAAARDHLSFMDKAERETLRAALRHELEDPAKGIKEDRSRYRQVQALLAEL